MKLGLWLFWLVFSTLAWSQGLVLLNDREGESFYLSSKTGEFWRSHLPDTEQLKNEFLESLKQSQPDLCSFKVLTALNLHAEKYNLLASDYLKALRAHGIVDDILYRILDTSLKIGGDPGAMNFGSTTVSAQDRLFPLYQFDTRQRSKKCFDENLKMLASDLRQKESQGVGKRQKKFKLRRSLIPLLNQARAKQIITSEQLKIFKLALKYKLESEPLTISQYLNKKRFLRAQFPVAPDERSDVITQKVSKKLKTSHRLKLLHQYNEVQIIRMGNLVKTMRQIMESPKVVISTFDTQDQVIHEREMLPTERYRYGIRLLRNEMNSFQANPLFDGKSPSYMDLVAAAYELGLISAGELEAVFRIEEFWNPKKTFLQKTMVWLRMFGTISAVIIPPPYGILATLSIIVIEATTNQDQEDQGIFLFE